MKFVVRYSTYAKLKEEVKKVREDSVGKNKSLEILNLKIKNKEEEIENLKRNLDDERRKTLTVKEEARIIRLESELEKAKDDLSKLNREFINCQQEMIDKLHNHLHQALINASDSEKKNQSVSRETVSERNSFEEVKHNFPDL